jgi:Lipocalin-like domain
MRRKLKKIGFKYCVGQTRRRSEVQLPPIWNWTIVSITQEQDNKKIDLYGPNPQGRAIRDADGHFSYIVTRGDLPKFASNRNSGTPEENKAVVQGSFAFFGTVTVNEAEKTYTIHTEVCTYPNWVGIERKISYAINGDELITTASGFIRRC